jgi:hypothetical protein
MRRRPTPKSLELLRVTLQKLEQTSDPASGDASIADLKRVLVNRIADLELVKTLEPDDVEVDEAPEPAHLIPPGSMTEESFHEMAGDSLQLEKLD